MLPAQRLSIHVLTDHFQAFMPDLLRSLQDQTLREFQMLVVDNASPEGADDLAYNPQVVVLRNPRPQTWSKAQNQALALALSRWEDQDLFGRAVVFVSPQIILAPDTLQRLWQALEQDPTLMIACPKILRAQTKVSEDGETRVLDFGQTIDSAGALITRGRKLVWRGAGQVDSEAWKTAAEIFTPSVEVFIVRASALQVLSKTGPWFDERLSPLAATLDFAWRLRLWGGRAACFGEALAWLQSPADMNTKRDGDALAICRASGLSDSPLVRLRHMPWIFLEKLRLAACPSLWSGLLVSFGRNLARWPDRGRRLEAAKVTSVDMANWFV